MPSSSDRTNPVAVALHYEPSEDTAPRVVASGHGPIAERIIALAREHNIAIRRNADLAELLNAVTPGEHIPVGAFAVVAEILYFILKAEGRLPPPSGARP